MVGFRDVRRSWKWFVSLRAGGRGEGGSQGQGRQADPCLRRGGLTRSLSDRAAGMDLAWTSAGVEALR